MAVTGMAGIREEVREHTYSLKTYNICTGRMSGWMDR